MWLGVQAPKSIDLRVLRPIASAHLNAESDFEGVFKLHIEQYVLQADDP